MPISIVAPLNPLLTRDEAKKVADISRVIQAGVKYYYSRQSAPAHHPSSDADDESDPFVEQFLVHLADIIDGKVQKEVSEQLSRLGNIPQMTGVDSNGASMQSLATATPFMPSLGGTAKVVYTADKTMGMPDMSQDDNDDAPPKKNKYEVEDDDDDDDDDDLDGAKKLGPLKLSDTMPFQMVTLSVIFANTVTIALEAHYIANEGKQAFFRQLEFWFCIGYIAELCVRWNDWGFHEFFWGHNCGWNWFDFLVTVLGALTILMAQFAGSESSGTSVIRIFRMLRMLRIFRAMKFIKDIEEVIAHAFRATMKLFFIAFIVVFIFGIMFCNLLWDTGDPTIDATFGNLELAMWSMFRLMTMDDWVKLIEPTLRYNPNFLILFIFYIFLASIALMSLVPAIFVEQSMNARERAIEERDAKATKEKRTHDQALLRELFKLADSDSSGQASLEELKKVIFDKEVMKKLQKEGLTNEGDIEDVTLGLFDLLEQLIEEHDHSAIQTTEKEFVNGVFKQRDDTSAAASWRATTAIRMQVYRFTAKLRKDMDKLEGKLDGVRDMVVVYLNGGTAPASTFEPREDSRGWGIFDAGMVSSRGAGDDACCGDPKKSPRGCGSAIFGTVQ
jgi:voltage-gated sodium channel